MSSAVASSLHEPVAVLPVEAAASLLGGASLLKRRVRTRIDVHEMLERGIPGSAFNYLVSHVTVLASADVHKAVGVSLRTMQRRSQAPRKPLSAGQSSRAWQFAEILARATDVLGTQELAERWLSMLALALDRRRPIDLLSTSIGAQMVEQILGRVEHGVYT